MSKNYSICCPEEGHAENKKQHKKTLLMIGETDIKVFCRMHGWIQLEFFRLGQRIDFRDITVQTQVIPKDKHIETEDMPLIAIGETVGSR